jgi:hypothetical protein
MCNILSDQKPAFTCKGICPNCRRKSELSQERPERKTEAAITPPMSDSQISLPLQGKMS